MDANRIKRENAVLEKKLTNSEKKVLKNNTKKIPSKAVEKNLISEPAKLFHLTSVETDLAHPLSNNNTCTMDKTFSMTRPSNNSPDLKSHNNNNILTGNKFEVLSQLRSDKDTV